VEVLRWEQASQSTAPRLPSCKMIVSHVCVLLLLFGGGAAARKRAPLARMHPELHQPPTTPQVYEMTSAEESFPARWAGWGWN
jgi:hypothetical protein